MNSIPYPGLRPFNYREAHIFFGREQHTEELFNKLTLNRFISVTGPSGCGKSSLVRAGLIPALVQQTFSKTPGNWWVGKIRPGHQPLENLTRSLLKPSLLEENPPTTIEEEPEIDQNILGKLRQGPLGLVELLREDPLPPQTSLLLLVDQFEDLLRNYSSKNHEQIEAFIALLLASVQQDDFPIYVIITMRSEFIGDCTLFSELSEMVAANHFLVPPLTDAQQRKAIIEPARIFDGNVKSDLVERLLEDMEHIFDQLPLLQHCLMRMWLRASSGARDTNHPIMTLGDYQAVGGLRHALSNHADETLWRLNARQKYIAERMFRRLGERRSNSRYTGMSVRVSEIADLAEASDSEVSEVIEFFRHSERRFLTPEAGISLTSDAIIAFGHESLTRQWKQLKRWIEQEAGSAETYRRLEHTACLWKEEKAALWRPSDLDHVLAWKEQQKPTAIWAKRYGNHFTLAMDFLEASARKQRYKRQIRVVLTIVGLLLLVAVTGWGIWERTQRIRAEAALITREIPGGDIRIRRVSVTDAQGLLVSAIRGRYLLRPGERINIDVEFEGPSLQEGYSLEFYHSTGDKTVSESTYLVPDRPGEEDRVEIKVIDAMTGKILVQKIINIQIVGAQK